MVDYYGLPGGWPGRRQSTAFSTTAEKANFVQTALHENIAAEMGTRFNSKRFVPFILMHEFEGLLFSDCAAFSRGIYQPELEVPFQSIRGQFSSPEGINDSPETAPSKRIVALLPGYQKPLLGTLAAIEIGLDRIRSECPLFDSWLRQLEGIPVE